MYARSVNSSCFLWDTSRDTHIVNTGTSDRVITRTGKKSLKGYKKIRKSKTDRQHNGQKRKDKRTNTDCYLNNGYIVRINQIVMATV